jgi:hypothetical protein
MSYARILGLFCSSSLTRYSNGTSSTFLVRRNLDVRVCVRIVRVGVGYNKSITFFIFTAFAKRNLKFAEEMLYRSAVFGVLDRPVCRTRIVTHSASLVSAVQFETVFGDAVEPSTVIVEKVICLVTLYLSDTGLASTFDRGGRWMKYHTAFPGQTFQRAPRGSTTFFFDRRKKCSLIARHIFHFDMERFTSEQCL